MIRLASNSTCLGLVETLLSPPQKIHRARILNKISLETDDIVDFSSFKKGIELLKKYNVNMS